MTFAEYEKMNFGYEVITTFFDDFSLAELFGGIAGVQDTFNRAFEEWKGNYKYLTELVIVTNSKCWIHYNEGNEELSRVYADLYHTAKDYAYENLKDEEMDYFFNITD